MTQTGMRTAGIDTGKDKLDVAVRGTVQGKAIAFSAENNPAGWNSLAGELAKAGVERIGIEATGGDERGVTHHL